jgi:RNase P/RNase MRP subunit p29
MASTNYGNNFLNITLDKSDVDAVVSALADVKGGAETAIMRSVNRSLTGVKTDMARETSKVLNIKQKRIKKDITIRKANKSDLSGMVSSKGKPVNLEQFGAKERKKGVSVKVLKSGGRKTIPGAFIFIGKNSNRLVGWRKKTDGAAQYIGTKKKDPNMAYGALPKKYRLPIESLYGPRIQDVTARPEIMQKIEEGAGVRLEKELDHQMQRILDKHRGK